MHLKGKIKVHKDSKTRLKEEADRKREADNTPGRQEELCETEKGQEDRMMPRKTGKGGKDDKTQEMEEQMDGWTEGCETEQTVER